MKDLIYLIDKALEVKFMVFFNILSLQKQLNRICEQGSPNKYEYLHSLQIRHLPFQRSFQSIQTLLKNILDSLDILLEIFIGLVPLNVLEEAFNGVHF